MRLSHHAVYLYGWVDGEGYGPLQGIEVHFRDHVAHTDENGRFEHDVYGQGLCHADCELTFLDVDGEANGGQWQDEVVQVPDDAAPDQWDQWVDMHVWLESSS